MGPHGAGTKEFEQELTEETERSIVNKQDLAADAGIPAGVPAGMARIFEQKAAKVAKKK